jgi:hypothetical protein
VAVDHDGVGFFELGIALLRADGVLEVGTESYFIW